MKRILIALSALATASIHADPSANARLLEPFDLADVRLLDGPFKDAQERDKQYILRAEPDRLMHWFRVNNGLKSDAKPYGEWKPKDYAMQGHYEGHYLSACAQMYRSTGDVRFKERLDRMVAIMAEVQAARGTGWLSPFPEQWVRILAGIEPRPKDFPGLPQPWYAQHKVYQGLVDAYTLAGNKQALDVMVGIAKWLETYSAEIGDPAFEKMLDQEHGGVNEALANLYVITKNPAHLALAKRFCHRLVMEPLARNEDTLDRLHANTQVPKFTGFARLYELTGEAQYRDAARNFWRYVVDDRSYANGGNSSYEKFTPKARLSHSLSDHNAETCNTHNMLKLSRHLFMWQPDSRAADYFERAQINHILSSQHPEYGTVAYFHGLIGGSKKGFSPGHVSFACCHGSGMENHAKYGDSIYFHRGGSDLYVNLFISSELKWKDSGLTIRQNTRFPEEQGTTITLSTPQPVRTALHLRKPFWAANGFAITINGKAVSSAAAANGYVRLDREWRDKDVIGVKLPMEFRWEAFKDNPDRAAMMYGPVLLVAETAEARRMATVAAPRDKALATLKPLDQPLRFSGDENLFRLDLKPQPVRLGPLYQNSGRDFYATYWDQETDVQKAAASKAYQAEVARWKQLAPQTVDIVYHQMATPAAANNMPGRLATDTALPRTAGADRTERDHDAEAQQGYNNEFNLIARSVAGLWQTFRTIELGMDRFGWTLEAEPGKNHVLLVRLWDPPANDPEARRATQCGLDVRVAAVVPNPGSATSGGAGGTQGNQLDTGGKAGVLPPLESIGTIGPAEAGGCFREVRFDIPAEMLAGKRHLAVRFFRQRDRVPGLVGEVRLISK
jgi:DUF1680 family protein